MMYVNIIRIVVIEKFIVDFIFSCIYMPLEQYAKHHNTKGKSNCYKREKNKECFHLGSFREKRRGSEPFRSVPGLPLSVGMISHTLI
jgi:hypothetical protein